jgi:NAD(P)-dependent dehydrogenase (short-subunit alcohol dehydrogenase family)
VRRPHSVSPARIGQPSERSARESSSSSDAATERGPAVVTGAAGGVGRSVVAALLDLGLETIVIGRTESSLRSLETASSGHVRPHVMDVRDEAAWHKFVNSLDVPVGVLVTAAGTSLREDFVATSPQQWRDLFDLNVFASLLAVRAVLPGMLAAGWGRVVLVSSGGARIGLRMRTIYSASKGAIEAFTRSLALEVAGSGVTVNALAPGILDTESTREWFAANPDIRAAALQRIPEGRFGDASEMMAAVQFIVRSTYLQGSVVVVDGGWTIE